MTDSAYPAGRDIPVVPRRRTVEDRLAQTITLGRLIDVLTMHEGEAVSHGPAFALVLFMDAEEAERGRAGDRSHPYPRI